jgi:membrane fusion protein (multidrug efflux system)
MSTSSSPPPSPPALPASPPGSAKPSRRLFIGVIAAIVGVTAVIFGVKRLQFALAHEDTDDAQVDGHVSPVLPRVPGYVSRVLVNDNQHVVAGQPVLEIDARELDLRVAQAQAAQLSAEAALSTDEAALATARADADSAASTIRTGEVRQRKAARDLARDLQLFKTGAITDSQLSDTQAAADTAAAQLESLRRAAAVTALQIPVAAARIAAARTQVAERAADLAYAKLQRSYGAVVAPIAGYVSRKNVEPGEFVQAGQTVLSIASDTDVWVVANFKETQLTRMRAGQPVEFTADSYPGVVFHGKVDSIAGTTGARFALLPPDNSTGNFVKVTQRIPVKIVFAEPPAGDHPLRPGMSVDAVVAVREEPR